MKILILQKLAMNSIGQYNPPFEPEPGELVECAIVEVLEIAQGDALALHDGGQTREGMLLLLAASAQNLEI